MATLLTGRTAAARLRLMGRNNVGERIDGGAESVLRRLLDGIDATRIPRPAGVPAENAAYFRTLIARDTRHETSLAHWLAGRSSTLHGHSESQVLIRVVAGTLVEERYLPESDGTYRYELETLEQGQESHLPRGAFHRLHCLIEATTVHAFSPPPSDATSPVPAELVPALEEAKTRLLEPLSAAITVQNQSIVEAVAQRADNWARWEEAQNQNDDVRVSAQTLAELRASGILSAPVPRELGGWDSSLAETAQAVRQLARQAPATALALAMPLGNAATTGIPDSAVPETLRAELAAGRRWIADETRAGRILAVANSEPGAGGDLAQTRTLAVRGTDGDYRLHGKKSFATLGPDADYFLCAARRAGEGPDGKDIVDGFFVARHAPGLVLDDAWDPLGMRATASVGLTLDGAPAAALLGYRGCLEGVNARHWSTVLFAAVFVGVGEGALAAATDALRGSGNSSYARAALARCRLNLDAAAGLLEAVAAADYLPLPSAARDQTVRAKTFAALTAVDTASQAAMLCGGRAYRANHSLSRFLHDALAGPLLRPPLAKAMDAIADQLFAA
jgi:alkylation response protein AidB-like acyl-CoA dehydrogenase